MNYARDIKFVYFTDIFHDASYSWYVCCNCGSHDNYMQTISAPYESRTLAISNIDKLCKFNVKNAISHMETGISTGNYWKGNDIIFETYDGHKFERTTKHFIKIFYKHYYYYNENEIFCKAIRQNYLKELPNDIWTMIKKYIIYI